MKKKNTLFVSALFIFLIGIFGTFAEDTVLTYKAYTLIDLKIPCINNGSYCSASAICNITLIYPGTNGSIFVNNALMTYQGSFFNYTLPSSNILGIYTGTASCIDNGNSGTNPIKFEITSTGDTKNFSFSLILAILTLVIFVIALYSGNEYIMFIDSILMLVMGIYGMVYGIGNVNDTFSMIASFIILGLGIMFMVISSLKAIAEVSEEGNVIGSWSGGEDDYDYYK